MAKTQNNTNSFAFSILMISCVTHFILMPYAQSSANSHYYEGHYLGILYYVFSGIIFTFFTISSLKQKKWKQSFVQIVLILVLIYWGHELRALYCFACANGG